MKNMDEKNWRKRFKYRVDLSSRVTHLTKGETAEEAFRNLINILEERRIRGSKTSSGFICGKTPAVCLQEAPLTAIAENLQYEEKLRKEENHKVRYLGFVLFCILCNINYTIEFLDKYFVEEIPQKFKYAYLQYYYICDFI